MDEPDAKRCRRDETSPESKNETNSSDDECVEGSNRDDLDFSNPGSGNEDVNYSITKRWRERVDVWDKWGREQVGQVLAKKLDVNELKLLNGEKLFLKIDESSALGRKLVAFALDIQDQKDEVRTSREAMVTLAAQIETLEIEKSDLAAQIETLEMEKSDLAAQIETFHEQNRLLQQDLLLQQNTVLIEQLIEMKEKLIDANEKLIDEKMRSIESKKQLIESKKQLIDANEKLIDEKTKSIEASTAKVKTFILGISEAHEKMRLKFMVVKNKGNETLVTATSQVQSQLDPRIDLTKIPSPSRFEKFGVETDDRFTDKLIGIVDAANKTTLTSFQGFVVALFNSAEKTDDSAENVKNTTDAILGWKNGTDVDKAIKYARPPTDNDKETTADQPILHAVLCRIIAILADSSTDSPDTSAVLHEYEHGLTTEQSVAGSYLHNMKRRRIDLTAHQRKEYLAVVLPTMVEKAVEIKTAPDEKGRFETAIKKGKSQVVGHLGKRLLYAFDFGGAGKNAEAAGICLTHLSIEVIKMTLSGVGTADIDLAATGTGLVPLLGTDLLSKGHEDFLKSTDANGFVLLAGALIYAIPKEFELMALTQVTPIEQELNDIQYLGSGAFSNVVAVGLKDKEGKGEFMKMPKSAALEKSLEGEAVILRKLQINGSSFSIPQLCLAENVSRIQSVIRGEISKMAGLRLVGIVGIPLHRVPRNKWADHSKDIITTVFKALQFAHNRNIYHLDVRPGNIIVDFPESGCKAMLSDWGCSVDSAVESSLKKFRGCTPYAHDSLLAQFKTVKLNSHLDFASLAYTLDHVAAGKLRWLYEFDRPLHVTENDRKRRWKFVSEWLKKEGLGLSKPLSNGIPPLSNEIPPLSNEIPSLSNDILDAFREAVQFEPGS
jgi:hypothetical protein